MYIYIYIYICIYTNVSIGGGRSTHSPRGYGQLSKCPVSFCGLDSGNLKFETARTNKQHICF